MDQTILRYKKKQSYIEALKEGLENSNGQWTDYTQEQVHEGVNLKMLRWFFVNMCDEL